MNTRRDFIFVDDLVDVVSKALDGMGHRGHYHISSGSDYAIKELFDETLAALKITPTEEVEVRERNPDDVFSILLDPSKTQQDFGWRATTPLAAGVRRTIEYYQKFGINETFTHLTPPAE
jgi:UDP-glucose 4-epimerase